MNHAQVIDHEAQMLIRFRSEGKKLAHLCADWDFMAIHADCDEISACCCDFDLEEDKILRDQIAEKKSTSKDFSSIGAPAHSGTEVVDETTILKVTVGQLRTAVNQAKGADIDLTTAIWSNLLMECDYHDID
jgi:hypothetical protein